MNDRRDFLKKIAALPLLTVLVPSMGSSEIAPDLVQEHVTSDLSSIPYDMNNMGTIGGVPVEVEEMLWESDSGVMNDLFTSTTLTISGRAIDADDLLLSACTSFRLLPFRLLVGGNVYTGMCMILGCEFDIHHTGLPTAFDAVVRGEPSIH